MFPQLPDGKIFEVFSNSQEIESEKYMVENQEDLCTKIEWTIPEKQHSREQD